MNLTVNGEAVPKEMVELEYQRLLKALGPRSTSGDLARLTPQLQRQALEHAIGRMLLLGEAHRREIKVAPEEVDLTLAALTEACGGAAGFQAHLAKLNIALPELRRQIEGARRTEKLIEEITRACPPPDEAELTAYLKEHPDEFLAGEQSPDSAAVQAELRETARRRLSAAAKNDLLSEFITGLRAAATIKASP